MRKSPGRHTTRPALVSNLEIIRRLCELLDNAQEIIKAQAEILEQHGIRTESGDIERQRQQFLTDVENTV